MPEKIEGWPMTFGRELWLLTRDLCESDDTEGNAQHGQEREFADVFHIAWLVGCFVLPKTHTHTDAVLTHSPPISATAEWS